MFPLGEMIGAGRKMEMSLSRVMPGGGTSLAVVVGGTKGYGCDNLLAYCGSRRDLAGDGNGNLAERSSR